ncbi:DNA cytosine methyltransferase [Actinokineospora enzanensis]|uniref:DNA cytosine methyltransferase n=1 Tax=Actinokineospora enzanensis TaxID=155975 RepID=UPI0003726E26|nr:DNA cytosine methyltransferase [Actinokineospora enzanensis]
MLTLIDHFCGAGGSAQGAEAVPGIQLIHAINHWDLAVQSHAANFPHADHSVTDLSTVDPRYFPKTDLGWFSPECTNHSQAKGIKRHTQPDLFGETLPDEAVVRSRATMWDVVTFTKVHQYQAVVVENVVDVLFWTDFDDWLLSMVNEGYDFKIVYANSMHFPTAKTLRAPQSRDRVYVVFWKRANKAPDLELRPAAYCAKCDVVVRAMQVFKKPGKSWPSDRWGRYRAQYTYRCPSATCRNAEVEPFAAPAASAIDWSLPGQRIGDRKKPLQPATLARITAGLKKYAVPQLVPAGGGWNEDTTPVSLPMRTRTTRETEGLAVPPGGLIVPCEGREGKQARSTNEPLRTQTTRAETGLLRPPDSALITAYYGSETKADPASQPLRTVTSHDRFGIAFIAELRGGGCKKKVRPITEPISTVTASGNHHMLVRNNGTRGPARDGMMCTPVTEPARTITTAGHQSLVGWTANLDFARFGVSASGELEDRGDLPPALAESTFRMLEPDEIRAAMAFNDGYTLLGTRRERVKQLGNAVTPPAAEWLLARIAESLGYPPLEYDELPFAA